MAGRKKMQEKYIQLKTLRTRFGLTQTVLGDLIGCNTSTYSGKENGNYKFTLKECVAIQEFLNGLLEKAGEEKQTLDQIFLATKCPKRN